MANNYEDNFSYLREELKINPSDAEQLEKCLAAMKQYSSPWWQEFKNNPVELAAKQLYESVLLIHLGTLKEGVEKVLGRKLGDGELSFTNQRLKEEFETKYQAMKG